MAGKSTSADSGSDNELVTNDGELASENGDNGDGDKRIDPATLTGLGDEYERDEFGNVRLTADGKPRKRRGRKPGSSGSVGRDRPTGTHNSKSNSQALNKSLDTLSQTILIFHMGLASVTKFDGLQLEKQESDALAASLANVMEQFDFAPDPRFTAIAGLVTTSVTIYGPRIYLYREQAKEKREQKRAEKATTASVTNFPGVGNLAG